MPPTAMMYRFLAPVLSAQLMTAPTGRPREMRNLAPAVPPRPLFDILGDGKKKEKRQSHEEVNSCITAEVTSPFFLPEMQKPLLPPAHPTPAQSARL